METASGRCNWVVGQGCIGARAELQFDSLSSGGMRRTILCLGAEEVDVESAADPVCRSPEVLYASYLCLPVAGLCDERISHHSCGEVKSLVDISSVDGVKAL